MNFHLYETAVESARGLITHLLDQMNQEPERVFNLAFSGGDAYALLFDIWGSEYADCTPWTRLRLFWVDECCVPVSHSDSHYGMMYRLLLQYVSDFEGCFFPIDGMAVPAEEAQHYAELVRRMVPAGPLGLPVFDAVFLAAEPDGSLSFIHAGEEYLLTSRHLFLHTDSPCSRHSRISMTGQLLGAARRLYFFMKGTAYQPLVHDIIQSGDTGPAVYAVHHGEEVELFLDQWAGASELCMTKFRGCQERAELDKKTSPSNVR